MKYEYRVIDGEGLRGEISDRLNEYAKDDWEPFLSCRNGRDFILRREKKPIPIDTQPRGESRETPEPVKAPSLPVAPPAPVQQRPVPPKFPQKGRK